MSDKIENILEDKKVSVNFKWIEAKSIEHFSNCINEILYKWKIDENILESIRKFSYMIVYLVEENPKKWKSKLSEDLKHDIGNMSGIFGQAFYSSAMNKKNWEITEEDKERVVNLVRALKTTINSIYILNYYIEMSQWYISVGTYENNLVNLFHSLKEGS